MQRSEIRTPKFRFVPKNKPNPAFALRRRKSTLLAKRGGSQEWGTARSWLWWPVSARYVRSGRQSESLEVEESPLLSADTPFDLRALMNERAGEKYALFDRYLNSQLVRVLKTIGFDVDYVRGEGQYLFDADGNRYLDLLSGWGVFALGRNHPTVAGALRQVLDVRPRRSGADGRLAAGRPAGRAAAGAHALARKAVLLQLRRRGGRGGDQVQPGRRPGARRSSTASTPSTA